MTGLPPQDLGWDDLFGPASDPGAAVEEARRSLGLDVPARGGYPDGGLGSGLAGLLEDEGQL